MVDLSAFMAQLPSNTEAKPYVDAIRRLSQLLCLASLIPVIGECRFARLHSHRKPVEEKQKADSPKAKAKAGEAAKAGKAEDDDEQLAASSQQVAPLGVLSVLFLVASEVSLCWELFTPSKKKASGPMGAIVTAVKSSVEGLGKQSKSKKAGMLDGAFGLVQTVMSDVNVFASIHGLAMLAVLVIVFCYVLQFLVTRPGKSWKSTIGSVGKGLFLLVPVAIFGAAHSEKIIKVSRALATEKLLDTLWLPLRCLGLLCAHPPQAEHGGTPGLFAGFQVASLFGMISCELVSGSQGWVRAIHSFANNPQLSGALIDLVDNPLLSGMAPMCIALVWLYYAHLSRRGGALLISVLCCCACQPVLLAMGWPKAAALLQLGTKMTGPAQLINIISVAYAMVFMMAILMGGTLSFVGACALAHLLTGIHGIEALTGLAES